MIYFFVALWLVGVFLAWCLIAIAGRSDKRKSIIGKIYIDGKELGDVTEFSINPGMFYKPGDFFLIKPYYDDKLLTKEPKDDS